jgi:hypothetical protein
VAWGGKDWLFLKVGRWGFLIFLINYFFGGVGWGGWRKKVGIYIFLLLLLLNFFGDMVM